MSSVISEIRALEEKLRLAELGPDHTFFERHVDDEMVFVAGGQASQPKQHIVEAHKPGNERKFTAVKMTETTIVDHGHTAIVTCTGAYEGPSGTHVLKFMRVWAKLPDGWKIVAGSLI